MEVKCFPCHHIRGHVNAHLNNCGEVNLDHMVKVEFARCLPYEVTIFPSSTVFFCPHLPLLLEKQHPVFYSLEAWSPSLAQGRRGVKLLPSGEQSIYIHWKSPGRENLSSCPHLFVFCLFVYSTTYLYQCYGLNCIPQKKKC